VIADEATSQQSAGVHKSKHLNVDGRTCTGWLPAELIIIIIHLCMTRARTTCMVCVVVVLCLSFYRAMLCIARNMLSEDVCPSVCPSHAGILSKRLTYHQTFPPSGSHTILFFSILNGMAILGRQMQGTISKNETERCLTFMTLIHVILQYNLGLILRCRNTVSSVLQLHTAATAIFCRRR